MNLPPIVSPQQWQAAHGRLLEQERELTAHRDAVAAERRRMPMTEVDRGYTFNGQDGERSLPDLFEGRRQLIVYSFFFEPDVDGWSEAGCTGCSLFLDNVGSSVLPHLHARDTSFVLASRAPVAALEIYRERMGWQIPWYSSTDDYFTDFDTGEWLGLNVFFRDGDRVFRTHFVDGREVEPIGSAWSLLDLTLLGRQETWEDSPEGWPQSPDYLWCRHDEYDQ